MSGQENRKKERYGLELPVMVTWMDRSGRTRRATGTTKNVSPSGAFIVCDSPIGEGCAIDLFIDLPMTLGSTRSRISASAKVVRETAELWPAAGHGHGIVFSNFSFTRF